MTGEGTPRPTIEETGTEKYHSGGLKNRVCTFRGGVWVGTTIDVCLSNSPTGIDGMGCDQVQVVTVSADCPRRPSLSCGGCLTKK
jgi:hypothetical protein